MSVCETDSDSQPLDSASTSPRMGKEAQMDKNRFLFFIPALNGIVMALRCQAGKV